VAAQQPSVFLTTAALAGNMSPCYGADGSGPAAVALNAALNNALDNTVTIFLNGVASGAAVTGLANDTRVTFTTGAESNGALPVSFEIPPINAQAPTPGVTLTNLQAGGVAVREYVVAVCVTAAPE
jgi:hypothetical protein